MEQNYIPDPPPLPQRYNMPQAPRGQASMFSSPYTVPVISSQLLSGTPLPHSSTELSSSSLGSTDNAVMPFPLSQTSSSQMIRSLSASTLGFQQTATPSVQSPYNLMGRNSLMSGRSSQIMPSSSGMQARSGSITPYMSGSTTPWRSSSNTPGISGLSTRVASNSNMHILPASSWRGMPDSSMEAMAVPSIDPRYNASTDGMVSSSSDAITGAYLYTKPLVDSSKQAIPFSYTHPMTGARRKSIRFSHNQGIRTSGSQLPVAPAFDMQPNVASHMGSAVQSGTVNNGYYSHSLDPWDNSGQIPLTQMPTQFREQRSMYQTTSGTTDDVLPVGVSSYMDGNPAVQTRTKTSQVLGIGCRIVWILYLVMSAFLLLGFGSYQVTGKVEVKGTETMKRDLGTIMVLLAILHLAGGFYLGFKAIRTHCVPVVTVRQAENTYQVQNPHYRPQDQECNLPTGRQVVSEHVAATGETASAGGSPLKQQDSQQEPLEKFPVKQVVVHQEPATDSPTSQVVVHQVSAAESPLRQMVLHQVPAAEPPPSQVVLQQGPTTGSPVKQTVPATKAVPGQVISQQGQAEGLPLKQVAPQQGPAEDSPAKQKDPKEGPSKRSSAKQLRFQQGPDVSLYTESTII